MPFDSNTARLAGRRSTRAGKPNKASAELIERINDILSDHFTPEKVSEYLEAIDPKERLMFLTRLLDYAVPKLKALEFSGTHDISNFEPPIIKFK